MKLLRLTSDKSDGSIETNFKEDIRIDANSQIALMNASFSVENDKFTIDSFNNTLTYQYLQFTSFDVRLTADIYDKATSHLLYEDIQKKLNAGLPTNGNTIGAQFICNNATTKTLIENKISPNSGQLYLDYTSGLSGTRTGSITMTKQTNNITINAQFASADDDQYIASYAEFGKGNSTLRTRIKKFTENTFLPGSNGYIIGLSNKNPNEWTFAGGNLDPTDKTYYIQVKNPSDVIYYYSPTIGEFTDTMQLDKDTNGDCIPDANHINIDLENGNLVYKIFRASLPNPVIIHTEAIDTSIPLYPFCIVRGNTDNLSIAGFKFTLDPFKSDLSKYLNVSLDEDDGSLGAVPVIIKNTASKYKSLTFQSIELAQALGFESSFLENQSSLKYWFSNKSPNNYILNIQNPYFIINSKSIDLETYDGEVDGRFNILSTFGDNTENSKGSVFYEVNNPVFLDIRNTTPRSIRNLRFQILNADLSKINNDGQISIVLLIK